MSESDWASKAEEVDRTFRPGGADQCCSRCQYWQRPWEELVVEYERGECHRHAPSPLQGAVSMIGRGIGAAAWATEETANIKHSDDNGHTDYTFECTDQYYVNEWPMTFGLEWCGDFAGLSTEKLALRDALLEEVRKLYAREKLAKTERPKEE